MGTEKKNTYIVLDVFYYNGNKKPLPYYERSFVICELNGYDHIEYFDETFTKDEFGLYTTDNLGKLNDVIYDGECGKIINRGFYETLEDAKNVVKYKLNVDLTRFEEHGHGFKYLDTYYGVYKLEELVSSFSSSFSTGVITANVEKLKQFLYFYKNNLVYIIGLDDVKFNLI